ncbi:MAG: hypothetical protein ACRD2A_22570, partial [Vicinamibacterales bacterium]
WLPRRPDDGSVVVVPRATLTHRVETLEHTMAGMADLPARIGDLERSLAEFREETQRGFAAVRSELRAEIREGDEETRRYMRVLHEDLISRIRTIGEGVDDLRGR